MLASALPAGSGTADAMAVGQQQRHAPALNRDPCTICTKSVFHSERARIPVEGLSTELLMHRDCFRCSRCRRPLSLASFYCCVEDGQIPLLFCPDHKPRATAGMPAAGLAPIADASEAGRPLSVLTQVERLQQNLNVGPKRSPRSTPMKAVRAKAARLVTIVKHGRMPKQLPTHVPPQPHTLQPQPQPPPRVISSQERGKARVQNLVSAVGAVVARTGLRGIAKHAKTVTVAASVFSPPKPKPQPRQQPAAGFAHIAPPEEASKAMRSERAPFAATNAPAEPAGRAPRAAARTLGARPAMPAARKLDTASAPSPTHQLKLNSASADELMQLPGVGRQLAAKIVAHRNQHGPFVSVGGLMAVSGIGSLLFKKLEPLICLSD